MIEQLYDEKSRKASELAEKEDRIRILNDELTALQDKDGQVKAIEEYLIDYYEKSRKDHQVDKSQEKEIKNVISKKNDDIKKALSLYENAEKSGEESTIKVAKKQSLDELKRVFGEIDIDIKRFHKKGISREYLVLLIDIMDKICTEGSTIGTIPQSYRQKIYKWNLEAEKIPWDEEIQNKKKEKESESRSEIAKELKKLRASATDINDKLTKIKKARTNNKSKCSRLYNKISEMEVGFSENENDIILKAEEKKQKAKEKYDNNIKKIEEECFLKTQEIDDCERSVGEIQNKIKQRYSDKAALENELNGVFVFSFNKKRSLKDQLTGVMDEITKLEYAFTHRQEELNKLKNACQVLSEKGRYINKEYEEDFEEIEEEKEEQVLKLKEKITEDRERVASLENDVQSADKKICKLKDTLKKLETKIAEAEKRAEGFHEDYVIKKYSKMAGIPNLISEKKKEIKSLSTDTRKLTKELSALDKEIAKEKSAQAQKEEEKRKAIIEKAKEEERIRQEKEERRIKIEKEMQSKEKEQEILKSKADPNFLERIAELVKELEDNKDHKLLQESACPLADDGMRLITNSIVRKKYTQRFETPNCKTYDISFVDHWGKPVSERRLIDQKPIGSVTSTSFELKSDDGFGNGNYYLIVQNFESRDVICACKYKINISFANDFDF